MRTSFVLLFATAALAGVGCNSILDIKDHALTNGMGGVGMAGSGASGMSAGGSAGASGAGGEVGATAGTGGVSGDGAGGASGTNAAGASSGATGGSSGASGSGGSAGASALLGIVGSWDGALVEFACGTANNPYDCQEPATAACQIAPSPATIPPSNGVTGSWVMGGTSGTVYNVTFHIRGVVEVNYYNGGTRAAGTTSVLTTPRNLFQSGGSAQSATGPSFDYNTYELDVTPGVAGADNIYFLNSVILTENPHAGPTTSHLTFDIDYSATIKVFAKGTVTLKVTDSNCDFVQNCGPSTACTMPWTVDLSGSTPAAPLDFPQPYQGTPSTHGQWVFFDITNVTVAQ